jgi:hypothetical protein
VLARPGSGGGLHSVRLSSHDPPPCKPPAMLTAGDSSRAGTGNMCLRIADIEAVDKPPIRQFGALYTESPGPPRRRVPSWLRTVVT